MRTLFVYVYLSCVKTDCKIVKSKDFATLQDCQKMLPMINGGYFVANKDIRKTKAACYEKGSEPSVITE